MDYDSKTVEELYEETMDSQLPKVPETNRVKNQQLIAKYEKQLMQSRKRVIMGVEKSVIIEETNR
jgi:hypothetical protein